GREEEWRFTPLARLRGLHTDNPPVPAAKVTVEVDPAPEVKISGAERSSGLPGRSFIPADRVSARAYASFDEATVIRVPAAAATPGCGPQPSRWAATSSGWPLRSGTPLPAVTPS